MKSLMLVACSMVLSTVAMAQSLGSQAQSIASSIQREERFMTTEQRSEIGRLLGEIRNVLNGDTGGDMDRAEYTCVSRDNDGRNPYVMAVRDGINISRITGETFSTEAECRDTLSSVRRIRGNALLCVSRDNDGRNPYLLAALDGMNLQRVGRTSVSSKAECLTTLNSLRVRGTTATICVSRDNDGRNPYVAAALDVRTMSLQVGGESFGTKADCERFLQN